jgi:hypothetical protein
LEQLAEQVAKLSNSGCLEAESITGMKSRISRCLSTALPVTEQVTEGDPPGLPRSPPTGGCSIWDASPSPPPENNVEEGRQSSPARGRWHYTPEYSYEDRPELEVPEIRWEVLAKLIGKMGIYSRQERWIVTNKRTQGGKWPTQV